MTDNLGTIMQNYETKPFDLTLALQGKQLVTENGLKARVVDNSRQADDGRSMIVLVQTATGEEVRSYRPDGTCNTPSRRLSMYIPITGGWVNIYANRTVDPTIYGTKTQALNAAAPYCVATIHTTWTEK